ncbi:MAG: hypothetical protein UY41_C0012G0007 [Candidatus Moranbacteria bacterium GW2011_GWE1_49_15]|nr:MAG: hypothetical protein UY41_C0012G0007 [Candidatus Moranbacteria bacterium GW2011_GWE1_49_15]
MKINVNGKRPINKKWLFKAIFCVSKFSAKSYFPIVSAISTNLFE